MSTATFPIRQVEPVQHLKIALADRTISADELVNRPVATRSPLLNEWIATVYAQESFAHLVSQYKDMFTDAYSPLDESDLAEHWRVLLHRPRQSLQLKEEELLYWDVTIKTPSTRPSTTILASVEYRGRAKPRPVVDPWD